jgi:hypothetical protein
MSIIPPTIPGYKCQCGNIYLNKEEREARKMWIKHRAAFEYKVRFSEHGIGYPFRAEMTFIP